MDYDLKILKELDEITVKKFLEEEKETKYGYLFSKS